MAPSPRPLPDWNKLTFSFTQPEWLYRSWGDSTRDPVWDAGEYVPFGDVPISPAAAFMSYGLGVFEGLKAFRGPDNRVRLFRADHNAERFRKSAERLTLAPFPPKRFLEVMEEYVRREMRLVPPHGKGSFYLRPMEHATGQRLGLGPVTQFLVLVYGSPVGVYFPGAGGSLRLKVLEQGRVAPGGTGAAKAMANYANGIWVAAQWKAKGFDDVLYLDARETRWVSETSGSNVFVRLRDGRLVTPPLNDQILDGSTRGATVRIARELLGMKVEERPIAIDEVIADGAEMFASGTAYTLLPIREFDYRGRTHAFPIGGACNELLSILRGIQDGTREDRWGWTREVRS